jgi:hypothetical protein
VGLQEVSSLSLQEVSSLSLCALVGRFSYWALSKLDITWWVEENWKPLLGYSPDVLALVREWFCFQLRAATDVERILERVWLCGSRSIMVRW